MAEKLSLEEARDELCIKFKLFAFNSITTDHLIKKVESILSRLCCEECEKIMAIKEQFKHKGKAIDIITPSGLPKKYAKQIGYDKCLNKIKSIIKEKR